MTSFFNHSDSLNQLVESIRENEYAEHYKLSIIEWLRYEIDATGDEDEEGNSPATNETYELRTVKDLIAAVPHGRVEAFVNWLFQISMNLSSFEASLMDAIMEVEGKEASGKDLGFASDTYTWLDTEENELTFDINEYEPVDFNEENDSFSS